MTKLLMILASPFIAIVCLAMMIAVGIAGAPYGETETSDGDLFWRRP